MALRGAPPRRKRRRCSVTDSTAEIRELPGSSALAPAGNMSVVIVTCSNCGNTILLNSGVVGLVHAPKTGGVGP